MRVIVAISVVVAYVAALLFGTPAGGPGLAHAFALFWSVLFVWAYLLMDRSKPLVPLALVAVMTLLFPLVVLTWISLPFQPDWWIALQWVLQNIYEHGPLWGLEFTLPTLGAIGAVLVVERVGQSKAKRESPNVL